MTDRKKEIRHDAERLRYLADLMEESQIHLFADHNGHLCVEYPLHTGALSARRISMEPDILGEISEVMRRVADYSKVDF